MPGDTHDSRVDALAPLFASVGFDQADLQVARTRFHRVAADFPAPDGVRIEPMAVAGRHTLSFSPDAGDDGRTVLHLHGGAFVIGDVDVQLAVPALLALATGARVVSLDYRVAPEHPCPAAVDDLRDAYAALVAEGPVAALAGESAGATLAVLGAIRLRDEGLPPPGCVIALSPWIDLEPTDDPRRPEVGRDAVLSTEFLDAAATAWRGQLAPDDPRLSPRHADLSGLPPTLIHVGGAELLLGDSLWLAEHLATAGAHVELAVFPRMPHVFTAYPTLAPECDQSLSAVRTFVNDWSGPPTVSASSSSPT
jgi:acetyl esterase/lipase